MPTRNDDLARLRADIGRAFTAARTSAGRSQADIAAAIGGAREATQSRISRFERPGTDGKGGRMDVAELVLAVRALGTTVGAILALADVERGVTTVEEAVSLDARLAPDDRRYLLALLGAMRETERHPGRRGGPLSAEQVAAGLAALSPQIRIALWSHWDLEQRSADEAAAAKRQQTKRGRKGPQPTS